MFLNRLKEENKESFLKLCVFASLANGVFADEEKSTLFAYCREMNMKEYIPETSESFEELTDHICQKATVEERNIIVLEILALVKADGVYDEKEQQFMTDLTEGLSMSPSVVEKFDLLLSKYIEIGKELFAAIVE